MAAALVDYAKSHSVEPKPEKVDEFQNFPGEGIYGRIDGKDIYVGNRKIVARAGCETGRKARPPIYMCVCICGVRILDHAYANVINFYNACFKLN